MEQRDNDDVIVVFKYLLKARILIDFRFYKAMSDLSAFDLKWCRHDVLCTIADEELYFCF